jgi:hypothetical protein
MININPLSSIQTPTKQPALRLSRTKNLHFAKATFPGFSADEEKMEKAMSSLGSVAILGDF